MADIYSRAFALSSKDEPDRQYSRVTSAKRRRKNASDRLRL
jgi:hypothetical protein